MCTSLQASSCLHDYIALRLEHLLCEIIVLQLLAHEGIRRAVKLRYRLIVATFLQLVQVIALCCHLAANLLDFSLRATE